MTFIKRSVVLGRAVTILRSIETYLRIGCLPLANSERERGVYESRRPRSCSDVWPHDLFTSHKNNIQHKHDQHKQKHITTIKKKNIFFAIMQRLKLGIK